MIKKIVKYIGFTLVGLFFALLIAPFIFKEDIVEGIKNAIQDNVNADVDFKTVDVSLIASFPDMKVDIKDLSIIGRDTFEGVELLKMESFSLDLDIVALLFGDEPPVINYFSLKNGGFHVLVLPDGSANYNIMKQDTAKSSTSPASFKLAISAYSFENVDLLYVNQSMPLYMNMKNVHHEGSGDFTESVFDLQTDTKADSLTIRYDELEYIRNAAIGLKAGINVNTENMSFKLLDNILSLNKLNITGDGAIDMDNDSISVDLKLKTEKENIRNLLSAIPSFYTADFPNIKTEGTAMISLDMKGVYHGIQNLMPGFQMLANIENGFIQYPGSPVSLSDLNLDVSVGAKDPQYRDLSVNIPKFSCTVMQDRIHGHLTINHALANQAFSGAIAGTLNLRNIQQALQLNSFEQLQGVLQGELAFKALMKDIEAENYANIDAKGSVLGKNIKVKSQGQPAIQMASIESQFSPKSITWNAAQVKIDKGTYQFSGQVTNPLAAFTLDKGIRSNLTLSGDFLDVNAWSSGAPVQKEMPEQPAFEMSEKQTAFINQSSLEVAFNVKEIVFGANTYKDVQLLGDFQSNVFNIENLSTTFGQNDISMHGIVSNAFDYLFANGVLQGQLFINSKQLNANALLGNETASSSNEVVSNYQVPDRMDIMLTADIGTLQYTDLILKNVNGIFAIKNQEASIKDLSTETLGGKIQMQGLYNSKEVEHPDYSLKLDLSKIKFAEAFKKLPIFQKLVPVAEYIDGIFNTTLVMKGKLNEGMSPDLASLDASGFIETLQGKINSYPPLMKIGNTLQIKELKEFDLTDTKNWFEIVRGMVDIKPWNTKLGDIAMEIQGKHSFATGMDFNITLDIPRKLLEKSNITQAANTGLNFLEKEAQKLGIPFSQGEYIPVLVNLKGKLSSPAISIKPLVGKVGSAGNILQDKANSVGQTAKDSLTKVLRKEKEKAKDSLNKVIKKETDKIKTKAEEETRKVVDDVKQKAKEKLDTLTKGVIQDTLKKKAEEVLNKNVDKEIDKIKDKLKDFDPFKKKKDKN